jgi:exonuclease V
MKRGSAVHQVLEEEVHKMVPVDVTTTEDALGLRLWNVIQGLRTLRKTGMTREFEIWGVVDGLLVVGVIDEITFACPDEELESESLSGSGSPKMEATKSHPAVQTITTNYVGIPCTHSKDTLSDGAWVLPKKVYLTDVKTRRAKNLPNGASVRPTLFQLMLYHRFFSNLASGNFDADILFRRYRVDTSANFSDSFINQIAVLDGYNNRVAREGVERTEPDASRDSLGLLGNNSVKSLWGLVMQEYQLTVPTGVLGIGNVLKVEYRSQTDSSVIGQKTFLHQDKVLDEYLTDKMMWWRGEREGRGVVIEEAYKCQSCDFADTCTWRVAKTQELVKVSVK